MTIGEYMSRHPEDMFSFSDPNARSCLSVGRIYMLAPSVLRDKIQHCPEHYLIRADGNEAVLVELL